jgi:hypothetical protein
LDLAHSYRAEKDLERLIERCSENGEHAPDERDELWKESIKACPERRRREGT